MRLAVRRGHAAAIVPARKPWFEAQRSRIPQKSQLAKVIHDRLVHRSGLIRFLDDGALELNTNPIESQICPITVARKILYLSVMKSALETSPWLPRWS